MADSKTLEILITARDMATGTLNEVNAGFSRMQSVMSGAALGAIGIWALNTGKELAQLGAQADRVATGFQNVTASVGVSSSAMLEKLRSASHGTIDDMNLMLSANKAVMLGVTTNADELAKLLEIARVRGAAMGEGTAQAFDDLVRGIGRMSPMILDNLGILTGGTKTFDAYAKSIGKASDELTDAEKRQALLNKVMADSAGIMETSGGSATNAAGSFASLTAQITNLKTEIGKGLAESTGPAAANLATFVGRATEGQRVMNEYRDAIDQAKASMGLFGDIKLSLQLNELNREFGLGKITLDEYRAGMDALLPSFAAAETAAGSLGVMIDEIAATAAIDAVTMKTQRLQGAVQAGYGAGMDPWLAARSGTSGLKMQTTNADIVARDERATNDVLQRMERNAKESTRGISTVAKQGDAEMRSLIESLLQPTSVTDMDMMQTKLGTYTDKWDEYVRRIRAGAQDAKSQWRNLIPTDVLAQGQDAVNAWAKSAEKAFYGGQNIEAINWDAFIAQAKEQIQQKQAREALIAEAGKRLSAAGIGGGQVKTAELLGLGGGGEGAAADTGAMVAGVVQSGVGITISTTITDQIKGQSDTWTTTGQLMMTAFLTGAQTAITPETGQKFITAIWPWMAPLVKQVANQGYRQ